MDATRAIAEARAALPWAFAWAPVLVFAPVTLLATLAVLASGFSGFARRLADARDAHWTERARLAMVPRVAAQWAMWPPIVGAALASLTRGDAGPPGWQVVLLVAAPSVVAVLVGRHRARTLLFGARSPAETVKTVLVSLLLRVPHVLVSLATMWLLPVPFRPASLVLLLAAVGAVVLCLLGFQLHLLRVLGLAGPADERLRRIVAGPAERLGIRVRAIYELDWPIVNAFALPLAGVVVFTRPTLVALDDEALETVAAHELGHLAEPPSMQRARLFTTIAVLVPLMLIRLAFHSPLALVLAAGLFVAGALVSRRLRQAEALADRVAKRAELAPGTYARALERVYEANLVPAVLSGRQRHPHLYDRMLAAGVTPSYPRPLPPTGAERLRPVLVVSLAILLFLPFSDSFLPAGSLPRRTVGALVRPEAALFRDEAARAVTEGRYDDAVLFWRGAAAVDGSVREVVDEILLLLDKRRCAEASRLVREVPDRALPAAVRPALLSRWVVASTCEAPRELDVGDGD